MGRVADKYFKIEYEERRDFSFNRLQLIEHQIRDEVAYINKLSNLTLGRDAAPGYKAELSSVLEEINNPKKSSIIKNKISEKKCLKKVRYKNKNVIAFPGKNENILEDMVTTVEPPHEQPSKTCKPTKKSNITFLYLIYLFIKQHSFLGRKIGGNQNKTSTSNKKTDQPVLKMSNFLDSESSSSSDDDSADTEDIYGDIIWSMLNDER